MVRTLSIQELDERIATETDMGAKVKLQTLRPFAVRREAIPATGFDGNDARIVWLIGEPYAASVRKELGAVDA